MKKELKQAIAELICACLGHRWLAGEQNGRQIRYCARCGKMIKFISVQDFGNILEVL